MMISHLAFLPKLAFVLFLILSPQVADNAWPLDFPHFTLIDGNMQYIMLDRFLFSKVQYLNQENVEQKKYSNKYSKENLHKWVL